MIETTPRQILNAMQQPRPSGWTRLTGVAKPADVAWEIQKVVEALTTTINFYHKRRIAILEELGEVDEERREYTFPTADAEQAFAREHERLLEFPVRLDLDKLERRHADAAELTVADIVLLRWLFERDEVEVEDPFAGFGQESDHDN